jgi:hypothetical protein
MAKPLLLLIALFMSFAAVAQVSPRGPRGDGSHGRVRSNDGSCPLVYFGFSSGINNAVGLFGPQIDIAFTESFSAGTGFGISSWGYKFFGEGRFYFDACNRGWALGAGVTYNTGIRNFVLQDAETRGGMMDVPVDLHPQTNIMISAYRFFNIGRSGRNRFHLQVGGSIPTSGKKYTQLDGPPLTGNPVQTLKTISPGGLLVGLGFSFGAGRRRS